MQLLTWLRWLIIAGLCLRQGPLKRFQPFCCDTSHRFVLLDLHLPALVLPFRFASFPIPAKGKAPIVRLSLCKGNKKRSGLGAGHSFEQKKNLRCANCKNREPKWAPCSSAGLAGMAGIEPARAESKSAVLPLDYTPV